MRGRPIISGSLLGKPRDRAGGVSRFILEAHAIKQNIDLLVEHNQDIFEIWLPLAASVPFSNTVADSLNTCLDYSQVSAQKLCNRTIILQRCFVVMAGFSVVNFCNFLRV